MKYANQIQYKKKTAKIHVLSVNCISQWENKIANTEQEYLLKSSAALSIFQSYICQVKLLIFFFTFSIHF